MARVAVPKTFFRGKPRSRSGGAFGWQGKVRVTTNKQSVSALANTRESDRFSKMLAERAVQIARDHFNSLVVHSHPVTPPPYANSFFISRVVLNGKGGYIFGNNDPASMWVEFGTHPGGGSTRTLGYRPLGYALDRMTGNLGTSLQPRRPSSRSGKALRRHKALSKSLKAGKKIGRKAYKELSKTLSKGMSRSLRKTYKVLGKTLSISLKRAGSGLKRI